MTTTPASTVVTTSADNRPMTNAGGSTAVTSVNMTTTVTTVTAATTGAGYGSVVATDGLAATAMPRLQSGFSFPHVFASGVAASSVVSVPGAALSISVE
ncbi:hypothetical protein ON010_g16347 [Phytophthora cinnamomi]|nr:hypothetical protein ON010_g16347 [Phytophthora cinnamomi]